MNPAYSLSQPFSNSCFGIVIVGLRYQAPPTDSSSEASSDFRIRFSRAWPKVLPSDVPASPCAWIAGWPNCPDYDYDGKRIRLNRVIRESSTIGCVCPDGREGLVWSDLFTV